MKTIFCILAVLCLYACGLAQPIPPTNIAIGIGETMPDVILPNIYNHSLKKGRFSGLQKDLTIIDFWATWCGACIGTFDKMEALQHKFAQRVQILMVNASPTEDNKKLEAFFQKRKERTGKIFTLAFSIQDTVLSHLFPFKVIPHYVWLDRERKVVAITESEAVTAANIEAFLRGKPPELAFKNDALLFDESKDSLLPSNGETVALLHRSFLTAEQPGLGIKVSYESVNDSTVKKLRVLNYPLLQLYQIANPIAFANNDGRIRMDSAAIILLEQYEPQAERKKYCYELETKPVTRTEALEYLATDLERFFKTKATAGEECLSSYILKAGRNVSKLYSKGGPPGSDFDKGSIDLYISNGSMASLTSLLRVLLKRPVQDETGISQPIDIRMPVSLYQFSPEQLKVFLLGKGIELDEGERLLPITNIRTIQQP